MCNYENFLEKLAARLLILLMTVAGVGGVSVLFICRSAHNGILGIVALGLAFMLYLQYKKDFPGEKDTEDGHK